MGTALRKNYVGKRQAVGVVNDEWNSVLSGDGVQPVHFGIGQHVAGGVGGARHANCTDIRANLERIKINAILELPIVEVIDRRFVGDKVLPIDENILVANVFGCQWQENFSLAAALRLRIP